MLLSFKIVKINDNYFVWYIKTIDVIKFDFSLIILLLYSLKTFFWTHQPRVFQN